MSRTVHLNLPGYGPPDGRCFRCSGMYGTSVNSSCGKYMSSPQVSLRCISRAAFIICNANSSSHRRNPDFSRHNKHGFSRNRNRQNEEGGGFDNLEESELYSSKNGPLLAVSGTPKFQATSTPGPREKEIVELFRKVQAQLRERAAIKEEKKIEESKAPSRETETVNSLLKLLRKHTVQRGKRSSNSTKSGDFLLDQPEMNDLMAEEKRTGLLDPSSLSLKHIPEEGGKATFFSRPKSSFQRRSPVPRVKFQPIHSDEDSDYYVSVTNSKPQKKETIPEPEVKPEQETKLKIEPESVLEPMPILSDGDVFGGMLEDEASDIGENEIDDEEEEEEELNPVEHKDLCGMKLTELRVIAKSCGIKGFSKLKKHELVELLTCGRL